MQFRCSLVTDFWQTVVVPSRHAIWAGAFLPARSSALHHRESLSVETWGGNLGTYPGSNSQKLVNSASPTPPTQAKTGLDWAT